jgi:phosphopantetheinyl transferase
MGEIAPVIWAHDTATAAFSTCWEFLDAKERQQAERYSKGSDRRAFVATRAALRCMLASIAGREPAAFRFAMGAWGKPFIVAPAAHAGLQFSVAHSETVSLVAVAPFRRVGVDIERRRRVDGWQRIATRVLGVELAAQLMRIDDEVRDHAFLRSWTAAEAFAKATGLGWGGLGGGVLLSANDATVSRLWIASGPMAAPGLEWSVLELDAGPDHVATLVIESAPYHEMHERFARPITVTPDLIL